jgi:uncharacterized protein YndB with AHSA1/START domain
MSRDGGVIERQVFIVAPPEVVFKFLTKPELMLHWLGSSQQLDPQTGGVFEVEVSPGNIARGEYTEVVPFCRVAFTWGWKSPRSDLAALLPGTSLVEIELEPREGGTHLRLRHSRLPEELQAIHVERWFVHLGRLATFFDGRPSGASSL